MKKTNIFLAASIAALLSGCGGGSTTDVTSTSTPTQSNVALAMPSTLELAKESTASAASYALFSDTGTDYEKHVATSYIDGDIESLEMINEILQVITDSGYQDFVNAGPYKALITPPGGDDHQSQGGGSKVDTKVEKLTPMTLNVTRADDESPMEIDFWMDMEESAGPTDTFILKIKGHINVTKAADNDTLPWGVFSFNVTGVAKMPGADTETTVISMAIKTIENADGKAEMEFYDLEGFPDDEGNPSASLNQVHVISDKDLTAGNMRLLQDGQYTEDLYVTFNKDYYMMKDSSDNPNEFSKKTDDLNERVHNYSLFNKGTGAKIELTAGMPFKTADGGFGYVGNWGVWAENQALIVDGAEVTSEGSTAATYTVVAKGGKLIKHSKVSKTLADINGLPLNLWICGESGCSGLIIAWDGNNFMVTGTEAQNEDTGQYAITSLDTPVALTQSGGTYNVSKWESAWSNNLNTSIQLGYLMYQEGGLTDSTEITYHVETTVQPGDETAPTTLYTKSWVPTLTEGVDVDALATQQSTHWGSPPSETTLSFDPTTYELKNGDNSVTVLDSLSLANSQYNWGFHVWGLVTTSNEEPNTVETYYSWQTGKDSWNKFTSIKDSEDKMVEFAQPIRMSYKHLTANDRNDDSSKNNMLYQIDYDGSNLGIPWIYDSTTLDWYPEFSLKDGTTLTDGTTEYVVKASDISKSMIMLSTGGDGQPAYVSGLTVDETTSDPTLVYDATVIAAMPAQPTLGSDGNAIQVKVSKGVKVE